MKQRLSMIVYDIQLAPHCSRAFVRLVASLLLLLTAKNVVAVEPDAFIRVNQLGFSPNAVKTAVAFSRANVPQKFQLLEENTQRVAFESDSQKLDDGWGEFKQHAVLDFSAFDKPGRYYLQCAGIKSPAFAIDSAVYKELPDQLLEFMRQQRCGYNPWVDAVCHPFDGRTVDGPLPAGSYIDARGGWHDAGDQLKYLLTASNATAQMLLAYQLGDKKRFADHVNSLGQPTPNGIPDVLDEARWGLDWMLRLHPRRISYITKSRTTAITRPASACRKMKRSITAGGPAGRALCTRRMENPKVCSSTKASRRASRI